MGDDTQERKTGGLVEVPIGAVNIIVLFFSYAAYNSHLTQTALNCFVTGEVWAEQADSKDHIYLTFDSNVIGG